MERPSRIVGQPGEHLGVLVSGVVVHVGMDDLCRRHRVLDLVEEGDELLVAMARRTAPENRALQRVQRSEQRGRAVADVIVGEGRTLARLERQSSLSSSLVPGSGTSRRWTAPRHGAAAPCGGPPCRRVSRRSSGSVERLKVLTRWGCRR